MFEYSKFTGDLSIFLLWKYACLVCIQFSLYSVPKIYPNWYIRSLSSKLAFFPTNGIVIFSKLVQPENAPSPIAITDLGTYIYFKLMQSLKALSAISVT